MIIRHLMARCTETIRIHEKLRQLPRLFPHCIHLLGPVLGTQCLPFPSCSLNHPIHSTFEFSLAENRRECRANLKRESVNVEFERNGEIGDLVIPLGRLVDLPGPNAPKDGCLPLSFFTINRGRYEQFVETVDISPTAFVVLLLCLPAKQIENFRNNSPFCRSRKMYFN